MWEIAPTLLDAKVGRIHSMDPACVVYPCVVHPPVAIEESRQAWNLRQRIRSHVSGCTED